MTLQTTVEAIARWIDSCATQPQLDICKDMIGDYVEKRWKNHVGNDVMRAATNILWIKILDKQNEFDT